MPEVILQHVKGHQDCETQYRHLSLLAQLNVDADAQASQYQREHGSFQPDVLLTEWAGVHLDFPTGTVTSHYETPLRYQATAPAQKNHLMERHSWTRHILATINWDAHGKALRRHLDKRTHLLAAYSSLSVSILRVMADEVFPAYGTQPDVMSSIQCLALKCCYFRRFRNGLHSPEETMYQKHPTDASPPAIRRLLFQLNAIGWDHIFLGRFSSEWSSLQDEYYARQAHSIDTKRSIGMRWQVAIISTIWQQWFLLWYMRNKVLHGVDSRSQAQAERRVVERTLIDIYDIRHQMEPSVQELLNRDITDHFSKTLTCNENWLVAVYGPLVKQSVKRVKAKAIQGVKSI
ncbi:hypothetical protein MHU86_15239 [Fragilaria crotonensis]|nr:hypothetical protein MHU86_15239 [Fragilaria crotonensis]